MPRGNASQPEPSHPAHHEETFDWRIFVRPAVISVFLMVLGWNYLLSSRSVTEFVMGGGPVQQTVREFRDVNLHLQMRLYQLLVEIAHPTRETPDNVRLVYIDDAVHWQLLKGDMPTPREALAALIASLSRPGSGADAIGLDVELLATMGAGPGQDADERKDADQALADAVRKAAENKVPVVLAAVYRPDGDERFTMLPNIFAGTGAISPPDADCSLIACPVFGYINLPEDKRQVPLTRMVSPVEGAAPQKLDSFAQALVEAFRQPIAQTRETLPVDSRPEQEDGTFGRFLPEEKFKSVSFVKLLNGDPAAINECKNKIVLIGGHWHELQSYGRFVDEHLSPAGDISGLALHANYVEAILQKQTAHEWPTWVDVVIDILFGLMVYTLFEITHQWWKIALLLLGISVMPLLVAYASLLALNVYLDFVLPIELYFLHILYELIYESVKGHLERPGSKMPEKHGHATFP